ncbi:MFS transporter [Pseudaminobacter salicylatoxidans]|nr:MFS transporter [Pseudaminobacter salicylatoxidans]
MRSQPGLLGQISAAHLVSHLHIMTVPALLPLLPDILNVNFIDLGIALGVFNIISALCQAPLGYAVDRYGARCVLIAGLALGSASFALVAAIPSFTVLLVAMAMAGLANGVYHPANYALLSQGMAPNRMGRAFSIHTFAGFFGGAIAPPIMVSTALASDIRWAFAVAAVSGFLVLAAIVSRSFAPLASLPEPSDSRIDVKHVRSTYAATSAIIMLTVLFMMLSLSTGTIERFSVAALVEGFGVPLSTANMALTTFLFASAFGVLTGGILADRTKRHGSVAVAAFALAAVLVATIALVKLPDTLLVLTMGGIGFLTGIVAPSRDMLVRAISPIGQEGRTFGIVSTGFNIGGVIGPILCGALLDRGLASAVLWASAGFMIITASVVTLQEYLAKARKDAHPITR